MEGNLCWNCKCLTFCKPLIRPQLKCVSFEPIDEAVSQYELAKYLGITRQRFVYFMRKEGPEKVIRMLKVKGIIVRCDKTSKYYKFYKIINQTDCI